MDPVQAEDRDKDAQLELTKPGVFGMPPLKNIRQLIEELQFYQEQMGDNAQVIVSWPGIPHRPLDNVALAAGPGIGSDTVAISPFFI
ncbi:hypothetical protein [Nocardia gipuzkoensis]